MWTWSWLERIEWSLIPLGVAAYLVMPHDIDADGLIRYVTTQQLWLGHITGTRYSIVQSILALPLYPLGEAIGRPLGMVARFNTIVFFAGLMVIAMMLRTQVPETLLRRLLLLLIAASMFANHVQVFFGEVLTVMCVAVGLLCLIAERRVTGYVLLAIGVVNTPATLPALFLSLLALPGPRRLWHATWPSVLTAALVMIEFQVRRGSPFLSGYEGDRGTVGAGPYSGRPGFSYPLILGVLSILFSFGKGLAFFTPGLWLMFKRPATETPLMLRSFQRAAAWFLVGLIVVYAKWFAWAGGWAWGPRFFLFACFPAAIALAVHLGDRRARLGVKAITLAVLCWSVWVAIDGEAIRLKNLGICTDNGYYLESLCWYSVEFSPLFHPFIVYPTISWREGIVAVYFALVGLVLAAPFAGDLARAGAERWRIRFSGGTQPVATIAATQR